MKYIFDTKGDKGVARVRITDSKDTEVVRVGKEKEISIGVGPHKDMTLRKLRMVARKIITVAKSAKVSVIAIDPKDLTFMSVGADDHTLGEELVVAMQMANYEFNTYKTKPKDGWPEVESVYFIGKCGKAFKEGVTRGQAISDSVNTCRDLANAPGGVMTPELLSKAAVAAAYKSKVKVQVLKVPQLKKLGMGALLGVGNGSSNPPTFTVMEYNGGKKSDRPIVIAGKGITFDSGGLNVKPGDHMNDMHMDMSGAAATIHAIVLASKLGVKKNIIGLIPAAENMPGGESYRPGDVLRTMSGKTIEVLNTDAEGRVVLADALCYAKRYNPRLVVDVATLTGAIMVALGSRAMGVFTRDSKLMMEAIEWAEESGDYAWPMPMWEEYEDSVKGTFGDVANIGKLGRYGGAIDGAMFLLQFTKDYPKDTKFMHIDMASRTTASDDELLAKGAAGTPVRFLLKLLEKY